MISDRFDRPKPHLNMFVSGKISMAAMVAAAAASAMRLKQGPLPFREHDRIKGKKARFYKPVNRPKTP